jgi:hypothetical protein
VRVFVVVVSYASTRGLIFIRTSGFVYRVRPDGTGIRKAIEQQILLLTAVSRDGRWLVGWSPLSGNEGTVTQAFPLAGGPPIQITASWGASIQLNWSPDGDFVRFRRAGWRES